MVSDRSAVARLAYGLLFWVAVPAGLAAWALAARPNVPLKAVHSPVAGAAAAGVGLILLVAGTWELIARGGGLPMNPFPPPRLVRSGIYQWIRSPIYIGFGLVCGGTSIGFGSASGLWLVTPVAWLAAAALVYGFERHDLMRRFGFDALRPPLLSLPRGDEERPTVLHRVAVYLWVLLPWLVTYYAVQALGPAPDAFPLALPFERHWPVVQWTELLYASVYVFVPLTPLLARSQRILRRFAVQGLISTVVVTLIWLAVPVLEVNRPFEPHGFLGWLLEYERTHSAGVAAFPAFHVLWALIAAETWTANARASGRRGWAWIGWTWATVIAASCITTGMHTVLEVAAAIVAFPLVRHYDMMWARLRKVVEWLANSWREWRIGRVRVISHGVWVAAAALIGLPIAGAAAGRDLFTAVILVALCALAGAGLWAQALEGSSKLLRPFGWYGGVLGGILGALAAGLLGAPVMRLLAAFFIAAPWIQSLGRLRCLVQGCCHGAPTTPAIGIRYRHRRSRVTQIANLADTPIHPTPLYSIGANLLIGVVLLRLRSLAAPDSLLVAIYLILGGVARFVEESFRGEPQTPIVGGLRVYQWLAVASVLAGAALSALPAEPGTSGFAPLDLRLLLAAMAMALISGFAMGVDFPASNRRFSRLASAD